MKISNEIFTAHYDDNGFYFILSDKNFPSPYIVATGGEDDINEEYAAEITKRWNAYPELVDALMNALNIIDANRLPNGIPLEKAYPEQHKKIETLLKSLNKYMVNTIMDMEQSNALIAIYAGAKYDERFCNYRFNDDPGFRKPNRIICTHVYMAKELLYHASADWLLPVVKQLINDLTIESEIHNTGYAYIGAITHEMISCYKDLTPLYNEVVKAIEHINLFKKYNSLTDTV